MFLQFQPLFDVFAEQIANFLIVNLQVRSMNKVFAAFRYLYRLKYVIKGSANAKQLWNEMKNFMKNIKHIMVHEQSNNYTFKKSNLW